MKKYELVSEMGGWVEMIECNVDVWHNNPNYSSSSFPAIYNKLRTHWKIVGDERILFLAFG
jgi:hypothetical protein